MRNIGFLKLRWEEITTGRCANGYEFCLLAMMKCQERSQDSYIGLVFLVFFKENLFTLNLIFRSLNLIALKLRFISFVKRKANSTIEQKRCKCHEKRDRLLVLKMEFNLRFPSGIKSLLIGPVFS